MFYEPILFLQAFSNPVLDLVMLAATLLGDPVTWVVISSVLFWSGREKHSAWIMGLIAFNAGVVGFLKKAFAIPRPSAEVVRVLDPLQKGTPSFPSGHSTLIASQATLFYEVKKHWRFWFALAIALVGVSRLYLGVHFLTDVVFGILIGGALGYLSYRLFVERKHVFFGWNVRKQESLVLFLLVATVVLAADVNVQVTYVGGVLAGYFAGLLIRPRKLMQNPLPLDITLYRSVGGVLGFGVLSLLGLSLITEFKAAGVLGSLLAGLWITFLYPFILKNVAFDDMFKR